MPYKTIDDTGADCEWRVREQSVWRSDIVAEIDCVPVDLTSVTITAIITASATDSTVLEPFVVTITNATAGEFSIEVAQPDADLAPGTYWWAMEWDVGFGDEPLVSGPFVVEPWVIVP
jgi:hypothetical protein